MTDRKALADPNETPEDVATLYSWANLHGAKYRDFSASRAQTREKARQRVQQAIEEERERIRKQAEAERTAEAAQAQEAAQQAAQSASQQVTQMYAAQRAAQDAARQAAQEAAQQAAAQLAAQESARQAAQAEAARLAAQQAQAAQAQAVQAAQQAAQAAQQAAQQAAWQQERYAALPTPAPMPPASSYVSSEPAYSPYAAPQPARPAAHPQQPAPMREESYAAPRTSWTRVEPREMPIRPAWLTTDHLDAASQPTVPPVADDTLQGSRERLVSRWFALRGVFDSVGAPAETAPVPPPSRAPVLAVFSLAGGVGKTSLVATLGRALSARGERVLLVDTAPYGLLPFFFGAHDQRPGVLRTFNPPAASGDAPIQMLTVDPEAMGPESAAHETLSAEISKHAHGVSRIIVDLATASGATTRRILRMAPMVVVPLVPDMNSVVSVGSIDSFFQRNSATAGKQVLPLYVLNQFDPSLPLHLDVREVLREQLGDRLLPFVLRRAPVVSEALAEGMTVMDYAPNSGLAEDFGSLAGWVKSLSAPASSGFRGVRWSER